MGAQRGVVENGWAYTAILLGSNVVIMLLFLNDGIFRGAGDATFAMRALWLANGINLLLDPCLIFGLGPFPELGLAGAALATTCGRGAGVIYQIIALRGGRSRITIRGEALRPYSKVVLRLVRLSLGGIGQFLIATASWVALMRLVSPFGSAALAGYTIAVRIVIFALLPSWGLANAAATLVGQNLGASQPQRAEKAVWITGWYNTLFPLVVTVLFVGLAPRLVGLFTDDGSIVPVAVASLRIISYGYVFYAWGMVLTQAFNGSRDTMTPTWLNMVCFWMLQIPLAWWLSGSGGLGPRGGVLGRGHRGIRAGGNGRGSLPHGSLEEAGGLTGSLEPGDRLGRFVRLAPRDRWGEYGGRATRNACRSKTGRLCHVDSPDDPSRLDHLALFSAPRRRAVHRWRRRRVFPRERLRDRAGLQRRGCRNLPGGRRGLRWLRSGL